MLACNTLRIDPGDGSPATEYRVEDDHVERRERPAVFPPGAHEALPTCGNHHRIKHILAEVILFQ